MIVFAYNLCLKFEIEDKHTQFRFETISFGDLMGFLFKGLSHPRQQFYVEADSSDDFVQHVFELQCNDVWRSTEITISFMFRSAAEHEQFLKKLLARFRQKDAAGGLVSNAQGEYLLIFSRERWSFPKGGIEWLEEPDAAAMREVTEETGIGELRILHKMPETYHTFSRRDQWQMKVTHWYRMETTTTKSPQPQKEEGIEAVRWVSKQAWIEGEWDAYPLVRHVFEQEFTHDIRTNPLA